MDTSLILRINGGLTKPLIIELISSITNEELSSIYLSNKIDLLIL
jgi:hypothetical protein